MRVVSLLGLASWVLWLCCGHLQLVHHVAAYNETLCRQERATWMDEYAKFHRANRGAAGARYLIYYCGPNQDLCAGTGDRVRGMLWLLRVAAVHRMVYIAEWTRPANISHFLTPAEIDWRLDGLPPDVVSKLGKQHNTYPDADFFNVAAGGGDLTRWRRTRIHTTTAWPASIVDHRIGNTSLWPAAGFLTLLGPLGGVPRDQEARWNSEFTWYLDISACWFHFAFKPSEAATRRAQAISESAFYLPPGAPLPPFVAWHWRTGGQRGETGIVRAENKEFFRSRLQQLMASINCGRSMVLQHAAGAAPLLVVTDLNPFRTWIRSGAMGPGVTTLPSVAQHVDMGGAMLEAYLDVLADMLVISRARCVLISQSGFSNVALIMRREPLCYLHMDVCLRQQEQLFERVEVR